MKKFLLTLLVAAGMVGTAKADYYLFYGYNYDNNWGQLCILTEESEGVYSSILNLEDKNLISWGSCTIVLSTQSELGDQWSNVVWPGLDDRTSILTADAFTLGAYQSGKEGKLYIPITEITPNTYAVKFTYTESTHQIKATRLVEFASSNDNWHSGDPVYLSETSHSTGVFTDNLTLPANTEFKFVVNGNSNDKSGQALWYGYSNDNGNIYISETGANMKVSADGVYTITATLSNYNYVAPVLVTATASVGSSGMATLSSPYALDFTGISDISAYTITGTNGNQLVLSQITGKVKANTGLYIEGAAGASEEIPTTICTTDPGTNLLKAGTGEKIYQTDGSKTNFILTTNNGESATPKFYKVNDNGNTVAVGKAYLQLEGTLARTYDYFCFGDDATGIDTINKSQLTSGNYFDLQGRKVTSPTKGLYIVDGKKVVIK